MKFNQYTLDNGLRVVTIPMQDNPAVTVLVMVETGSKYETKEKNGLSHFLEHMVFKGTAKRPKAIDIAKELESLGAQYNAFTSQEYTGYYAKVSPEHIDTALDVVSDIYLNPLLDEKEIEKEKGVIVEEIKMYQDMPQRQVHDLFSDLVYGDQPAGWPVTGNEKTVNSFKRNDFSDYIKSHYVAESTIVIVSGSFDEKETLKKIEKAFANISKDKNSGKIKVIENQEKPALRIKYKETDQTHLVMGVRAFDSKSTTDATMSVLSGLLGRGMSSRLFQKLREEMGVCYYIHSGNDISTDTGMFNISAGVDTKRVDEVIKTILSECKRIINEPIPEDEMKKVKDHIRGSLQLSMETSDARAEYIADDLIHKGKVETPIEFIERTQKVTAEEVKKIAEQIFVDKKLNLAIIGPYKETEENIARFAKILSFN